MSVAVPFGPQIGESLLHRLVREAKICEPRLVPLCNESDHNGVTPLMQACVCASHSSLNNVRWLLDIKADVNKQTRLGVSALMLACVHAGPEVVTLLLRGKASPSLRSTSGDSALDLAMRRGDRRIGHLLCPELVHRPHCRWGQQQATATVPLLAGSAEEDLKALDDAADCALLFPGQGSQFVGMCSAIANIPTVARMFRTASDVLGVDLLQVCLHGPEELLEETLFNQAAVFVCSLAAVEARTLAEPELLDGLQAVAGFSLGEITALVFAGSLAFRDGLALIKVRAEAMQQATSADPRPQGLLSVVGRTKDEVHVLCAKAAAKTGQLCEISNELFDEGFVCGGNLDALRELQSSAEKAGASKVQFVKARGAFHTKAMRGAASAVRCFLEDLRSQGRLGLPRICVWSNVTGGQYPTASRIEFEEAVCRNLSQQLYQPVLWRDVACDLLKTVSEHAVLFESGPGRQLRAMVQRQDPRTRERFRHISV
mmetsp:Transcript_107651/g.246473  ORF Transcript_107651/g.246473 Transcript_107651/m.246473 type:complete len:486 (+) Transcript_107651:1210-2667(+)